MKDDVIALMLIFDLDHTLFQTDILKQDIQDVFSTFGIKGDIFWDSFYKAYDINPNELGCYSPQKQLQVLGLTEKIPLVMDAVITIMKNRNGGYLYADVISSLHMFKNMGEVMVIVTKGDKNFNALKIEAAGLNQFCSATHVVQGSKVSAFSAYPNAHSTIVINDRLDELEESTRAFPAMVHLRITREKIEADSSDFPTFGTLEEVVSYIQSA